MRQINHAKRPSRESARILDEVYELRRECSDTFRESKDQVIRHDPIRP